MGNGFAGCWACATPGVTYRHVFDDVTWHAKCREVFVGIGSA